MHPYRPTFTEWASYPLICMSETNGLIIALFVLNLAVFAFTHVGEPPLISVADVPPRVMWTITALIGAIVGYIIGRTVGARAGHRAGARMMNELMYPSVRAGVIWSGPAVAAAGGQQNGPDHSGVAGATPQNNRVE